MCKTPQGMHLVTTCGKLKRPEFRNPLTEKEILAFICLAEKGGFEPPLGYEPKHAFQACDLNHSSTSP